MLFSALIIIIGLSLFETVSSVDNAIINAEVLSTMSPRARGWFLTWGMLVAVFVVRGLLPFFIIWIFNTKLNALQVLSATWSSNPLVLNSVNQSAPILLITGGVFLIFLFLQWFIVENKKFIPAIPKGVYFYFISAILFLIVALLALANNKLIFFGALIGLCLFFVTQGFKQNAEREEKKLLGSAKSDISKFLFLEIIDSTFSLDGVLGAFAFTLSVPLILLGNGLGALFVRQLTVGNIEKIRKYIYLKNGAMYSVLVLGIIMVLHSFGFQIPEYISPLITFVIVGFFFWKSTLSLVNDGV
ncbi:MAG: DUF475 domain-containing protein [Candidatus Pacebacteria bacterium]|nr:DUF475 domain-containing protein [Candidatus Paceibacterota bacterium]